MTVLDRRLHRATLLIITGLTVELGCTVWSTPQTFKLLTVVGVPLVLLGIAVLASALLEPAVAPESAGQRISTVGDEGKRK